MFEPTALRNACVASAILVLALTATPPAQAQQNRANAVPTGTLVSYPLEELERLRGELIDFVQAYRDMAKAFNPELARKLDGVDVQLQTLSVTDLTILRNGLAELSKLGSTTAMLDGVRRPNSARAGIIKSSPFPGAEYPSCGSSRTDDLAIDASDIALFIAEGIRDAASRACGQVVVALGFGGNGNLACIATDAIYLAIKAVNYGLHYCNDKIDSAEQASAFVRLEHLHTDLTTSVTNDNANTATLAAAIANSQSVIVVNANTNTAALNSAIGNTQAAIINNDNSNRSAIISNGDANRAAVINNDNANTTMLRDLLLRTQIEADLAGNDGSPAVALFQTPETQCSGVAPLNHCGLLGLVRQIVVQTISRLAGKNTSNANEQLSKGDTERAAGDFKAAYKEYRKAYKTAANT